MQNLPRKAYSSFKNNISNNKISINRGYYKSHLIIVINKPRLTMVSASRSTHTISGCLRYLWEDKFGTWLLSKGDRAKARWTTSCRDSKSERRIMVPAVAFFFIALVICELRNPATSRCDPIGVLEIRILAAKNTNFGSRITYSWRGNSTVYCLRCLTRNIHTLGLFNNWPKILPWNRESFLRILVYVTHF